MYLHPPSSLHRSHRAADAVRSAPRDERRGFAHRLDAASRGTLRPTVPTRTSTALGPALALLLATCSEPAPPPSPPPLPPDCGALVAAGHRASACDPAIHALLVEIVEAPDERRCRAAARLLLDPSPPVRGRVVSVHERPPDRGQTPLTAAELNALAETPLPGTLVIVPDLAPGPGVPPTSATLDGTPLTAGADGRLRSPTAPGAHTLEVRHANAETRTCVTLTACETVTLTAHGATLAPNPAVRPGPCVAE